MAFLHRPLWIACSLALSSTTWAAGLEITQHGTKEMAHGFAGTATLLEDASAIAHNPAGLLRLEGQQASLGATLLHADIEYDARVVSWRVEQDYGLAPREVMGPGAGSSKEITTIPHLYYAKRLNEDTAIGIGLYVPFGSGTTFPAGWAGRYHSEETNQTTINLNPSVAFRLNDSLTMGAGFIIQYYSAKLTNQVDIGYLVSEAILKRVEEQSGEAAAQSAASTLLNNYGSNPDYQVHNDVEMSSIAYGFNFGLLWQATDSLRLGLNYRSAISHIAEGDIKRVTLEQLGFKENMTLQVAADSGLSYQDAAETLEKAFDERGALGGDIISHIHLPQLLTLSAHWDVTKKLAIMGNATWTNWSVFEEIRLEYTSNNDRGGSDITNSGDDVRRRDLVQPLNFEDTIRLGVGLRYELFPSLVLRTGFSLDESPVKSGEYRTPRGPDADRTIFGIGASYRWSKDLEIDMAFSKINIAKAEISAPENPAGTQHRAEGHSQGNLTSVSMQMNYKF